MSCRKRRARSARATRHHRLGDRLYKWRLRHNLSQSEAALKLNMSARTLQEVGTRAGEAATPRARSSGTAHWPISVVLVDQLSWVVYVNHVYRCSDRFRSAKSLLSSTFYAQRQHASCSTPELSPLLD